MSFYETFGSVERSRSIRLEDRILPWEVGVQVTVQLGKAHHYLGPSRSPRP